MEPKETVKQIGWIVLGNVGIVVGLTLCMTILGAPAGIFVLIASGKMFWKAARAILEGGPRTPAPPLVP
jgi:hypothetical protein